MKALEQTAIDTANAIKGVFPGTYIEGQGVYTGAGYISNSTGYGKGTDLSGQMHKDRGQQSGLVWDAGRTGPTVNNYGTITVTQPKRRLDGSLFRDLGF